jgi:gamma-glutamylcyclotransferase (GGCT)/AIG2-like uncharacterized protein YtfP
MENSPNHHLFVYGSLLSGFKSPAYEYISRYFDLLAPARVQGMLYDMGEYPAAIPVDSQHHIEGELYCIRNVSEFTWAMAQLDDYEGVLVEHNEAPLYRRELVTVHSEDASHTAWIYWFNGDVTGRPVIPSGNLLEYIAAQR